MRQKVAWVAILLVVAALAGPAAAAPPPGTGGVRGVIIDSTTGKQFDTTGGATIAIDVFNLDTMARTVIWISNSGSSAYAIKGLAPGPYKLRFRYWDAGGNLARYRWNSDEPSFQTADEFAVLAAASIEIDATLRPMRGAQVSGTLVERGTGMPLTSVCYSIHLYESGGIGIGWITGPDKFGDWNLPKVPAGRWTALAIYTTGVMDPDGAGGVDPVDCGTGPAHLDTWYRGASGWPLSGGVVAHGATFHTGNTFMVSVGAPVTGLTIRMLPAPTCRGKVPTIFGTTLDDVINGTSGRDIISGLAGNDKLYGRGGNDIICGDAGNDLIRGGVGTDTAVGGPGTDDCDAEHTFSCNP